MEPFLFLLILALVALAAIVLIRTLTLSAAEPEPLPEVTGQDVDAQAAAERLAGAVRIPTLTGGDQAAFQALHAYLQEAFPHTHAALERTVVGEHSLLYTWSGTDPKAPPILLLGHQDVVPADPETRDDWTYPPFAGQIAEGYIWGRGTLDDKQSVVGLLAAVEILLQSGFQPRRTIVLAFGHDEETSGHGAQALAAHLRAAGMRFAYVLDEGMAVTEGIMAGVDVPTALIGIAEKRSFNLRLRVEGEGGHTSMPPVHTAIGQLSAAIHRLERHLPPLRWTPPVRQMFETVAPAMRFGTRLAFANLWLFGGIVKRRLDAADRTRALVRTTTAVSMLHAGVKPNVLPSRAEAVINARILPGETPQDVLRYMREVVDDPAIRVEPLGPIRREPAAVADVTGPSYRVLAHTIRQCFPDAVVAPGLVTGATDSRHYQGLTDAVYRFSPMQVTPEDLGRIHGVDERIGVAAYGRYVRFYMQLILNSDRGQV